MEMESGNPRIFSLLFQATSYQFDNYKNTRLLSCNKDDLKVYERNRSFKLPQQDTPYSLIFNYGDNFDESDTLHPEIRTIRTFTNHTKEVMVKVSLSILSFSSYSLSL